MIPFYLVTGFLGSGKTSFLLNILHDYSPQKRIAVIQNEFASSGTDGLTLKLEDKPFKLVEVNNGSVFCLCTQGTFCKTLENIVKDYNPELIFLEASGLSDPINIIELMQDEKIRDKITLSGIVTIVDSQNFRRTLNTLGRVRHQVMVADILLLNKCDLFQGDTEELKQEIRAINPFTEIHETRYCEVDPDKIISDTVIENRAANTFLKSESGGRPELNAIVLRINTRITREGLESFIHELQKDCPRIKGFANLVDGRVTAIQTVFEQADFREITGYSGPSEIVAFSGSLTPRELRWRFLEFTS